MAQPDLKRPKLSGTVAACTPALPSSPAFFMVEGPWRWRARRAALARTPVPTELHAEVLAWCMGSARAVRQPSLAEQVAPVARVIFDDATSTGHVLRVRVLCCRGCSAVTYARARRGAVSVARSTPCACALECRATMARTIPAARDSSSHSPSSSPPPVLTPSSLPSVVRRGTS